MRTGTPYSRRAPSSRVVAATLSCLLLFSPGSAGEPGYKTCTFPVQTCLDMMAAKLKGRAWLGIEYDDSAGPKAYRVTRVVPGSPAEAVGFRPGDILFSVQGVRFSDNSEATCGTCEATREIWKPGTKVSYVVLRKGKQVSLRPVLSSLPTDVLNQMVGMHMLEHARPVAPAPAP